MRCKIFYLYVAVFGSLCVASMARAQSTSLRKAEVAGTFYPSDPIALSDSLESFFRQAEKDVMIPYPVLAIISPHAGYQFSGRIAAHSYAQVAGRNIKTVVILGPSHLKPYAGISFHSASWWETPLGVIRVDTAIQRLLAGQLPFAHVFDSAFQNEHSVEDQIPFIQKSLGDVKIIPIACGALSAGEIFQLARVLSDAISLRKGQLLIVASSDMSHYKGARETYLRDSLSVADVNALDVDKLLQDINTGHAEFCGYGPVLTTMLVAEQAGALPRFLAYTNSAFTNGDTSREVGYGSFAFYKPDTAKSLTEHQRKTLLTLARVTLDTFVVTHHPARVKLKDSSLYFKAGVFVTLYKKGELRGCIGYIGPSTPVAQAVYELAQSASSKDPRFTPVLPQELKDIKLEISVLSPLKRLRDQSEIAIGSTGLFITKGTSSGILLPQVASENKWSPTEFLDQVALKAGLAKEDWRSADAKVYSFTAQVFGE